MRLLAGMSPNSERVSCSICLVRSILANTYVGLRHHVIARHALFSSGSNMSAYVDLAHTGAAYSTIE